MRCDKRPSGLIESLVRASQRSLANHGSPRLPAASQGICRPATRRTRQMEHRFMIKRQHSHLPKAAGFGGNGFARWLASGRNSGQGTGRRKGGARLARVVQRNCARRHAKFSSNLTFPSSRISTRAGTIAWSVGVRRGALKDMARKRQLCACPMIARTGDVPLCCLQSCEIYSVVESQNIGSSKRYALLPNARQVRVLPDTV